MNNMSVIKKTALVFTLTTSLTAAFISPVFAADSTQHASKASKHSALAVKHGAISSAKVASGVVAVPLIVVGSAGVASAAAGSALMANAVDQGPLTITEITITTDPSPKAVMKITKKGDK